MDEVALPFTGDTLVLLGVGILLPLVVTALTKWRAPAHVKNVVNLLLSTVAVSIQAGVDNLVNDDAFSWTEWGQGIILTWLISAFAYTKLWRDTAVNTGIGHATADLGVGKPVPEVPVVETRPVDAVSSGTVAPAAAPETTPWQEPYQE